MVDIAEHFVYIFCLYCRIYFFFKANSYFLFGPDNFRYVSLYELHLTNQRNAARQKIATETLAGSSAIGGECRFICGRIGRRLFNSSAPHPGENTTWLCGELYFPIMSVFYMESGHHAKTKRQINHFTTKGNSVCFCNYVLWIKTFTSGASDFSVLVQW